MSEFQKEELSLEETNKLRISLGLKPLVADDAPSSSTKPANDGATSSSEPPMLDSDAVAARNFQEKQQRDRREREDAELRERLARAQAKRDAARRLNGPTLADPEPTLGEASASSSSQDTLRWIKESKKRAKEHAARRAKELEEQEARAQAEYRDSDLVGLRVRHDADEFGEGEERILTLRDADVLDDGDDELMDAALDQAERDQKNMERKKGVKEYSGLDVDETLLGRKKGVLSKYDADLPESELESANDSGFRLGASVSAADRQARLRQEAEEAARRDNKQLLTLDYAKNQEVSDYLQEGDVGFKKPKAKKRKKAAKVKISFDDDEDDSQRGAASSSAAVADATADVEMDDIKPVARAPRREQTDNFVDDDELQASLAKSRRLKAKKTFKKMTPEMIAKSLAEQRAAEEAEQAAAGTSNGVASPMVTNGAIKEEDGEGGLTFDETSEFVRAIRERPLESETRPSARTIKQESPAASPDEVQIKREESASEGDVPMRELDSANVKVPDDADAALETVEVKEEAEEGEALAAVKSEPEDTSTDLSEPLIGRGMASTLSFLRQQGMVPHVDPELATREQQQREYDAWLASRRREEEARELQRAQSKASGSSVDQATREAQNRSRELEDARLAQERFRDYKPDVSIKYHDEFGRDLDQKEAWKHLSHVFHGKKPGTKKMEKRLKRIEEEQKRERMAAGDTPTGMMAAFQSRSERTGKAHMVLSVGSRDSAPQDNDLLDGKGKDGMQLQKPKRAVQKDKKKKSDEMMAVMPAVESSATAAGTASGDGVPTTSKPGGGWARIGSATPTASSSTPPAGAASGGSGFRPIASATESTSSTTGNAPFRLAFGVKRKLDGSS